jgi:predicted TIM-barrel fold metal-dependent hydrolase
MAMLPPGACDCHVHVFAPDRFPYWPGRSYTPGPALLDELLAFEAGLGIERVVLVQPSVYGVDNGCLVEALDQLGESARGVAVTDPDRITDAELDRLHEAGVRSVRVNLESRGERDVGTAARALAAASQRVAGRGWSLQVYTGLPVIAGLWDQIASLPSPVVLDHFGGARAERGLDQPGFAELLGLLATGRIYVKLSAPYRASTLEPDYADLAPLAKALIRTAPERMLWASDWPHTGGGATGSDARKERSLEEIEPFRDVDAGRALSLFTEWTSDPAAWRQILVANPARLYGFPGAA